MLLPKKNFFYTIIFFILLITIIIGCADEVKLNIFESKANPDIISLNANNKPKIKINVNFQKSSNNFDFAEVNALVKLYDKKNSLIFEGKTGPDGIVDFILIHNYDSPEIFFAEALVYDSLYSKCQHYGNCLMYYPGNNISVKKEIITYPVD